MSEFPDYYLFIPQGCPEHVRAAPALSSVACAAACLGYSPDDPKVRIYRRHPDATILVEPEEYAEMLTRREWRHKALPGAIAVTCASQSYFLSFTNGVLLPANMGAFPPPDQCHVYLLRNGELEEVDPDEYSVVVGDGPLNKWKFQAASVTP